MERFYNDRFIETVVQMIETRKKEKERLDAWAKFWHLSWTRYYADRTRTLEREISYWTSVLNQAVIERSVINSMTD